MGDEPNPAITPVAPNQPSCPTRLALVGDYSPEVPAHRAIPRALELACAATDCEISWRWIPTRNIQDVERDFADASALWLVPASPYANTAGVIEAIRWARESGRPFLGTCGGFQHALLEFARNVAGLTDADHAEINAQAGTLVVTPLHCPLVESTGEIRFVADSKLREAYGADRATEGYHCSYGFNSEHRARLEKAGLKFSAFDHAGEVRAFELPSHPFFIGTLYQPERSALGGEAHPLICAFVRAAKAVEL